MDFMRNAYFSLHLLRSTGIASAINKFEFLLLYIIQDWKFISGFSEELPKFPFSKGLTAKTTFSRVTLIKFEEGYDKKKEKKRANYQKSHFTNASESCVTTLLILKLSKTIFQKWLSNFSKISIFHLCINHH